MPQPRDDRGRFIPLDCPDPLCGAGRLVAVRPGVWQCDGLVDPGTPIQELDICPFEHVDGGRYRVHIY